MSFGLKQPDNISLKRNIPLHYHLGFQVGESLILDFLDKAKSLPVGNMTDDEVKTELRRIKQELAAKNNTYITEILSRCVSVK